VHALHIGSSRSQGGATVHGNLQPLCAECHAIKTQAEARMGRRSWAP
jgi:hypothetical protein